MNQDPALTKVQQAPPLGRFYTRPLDAWRRLRSNVVARNSVYSIGNQGLQSLLHAIQFLLLARALGSHEFGMVASVLAVTSVLLPFCGLGIGYVGVRHIARGQARAEQSLGNGLAVTVVTALIGVLLALMIGAAFLKEPGIWLLVLFFAISELLFSKYIDVAAHVFLGLHRQAVTFAFYHLLLSMRLACAAALYAGWTPPTALAWAQLHLFAGASSALVVFCVSAWLVGRPRINFAVAKSEVRKGIFISLTMSAHTAQTDADRVVLARMVNPATAGAYTAAFRMINLACMPITAALFSLQARVFQKAHETGISGALGALRPFILIAVPYCLCLGLGIYAAAPAMPWLLGESYQLSTEILRWLCVLPLLITFQAAANLALLGVDEERRVSFLTMLTAGLSILLNVLLVPEYGWRGAVTAAYAAQAFLIAGLLMMIFRALRAQTHSNLAPHERAALKTL